MFKRPEFFKVQDHLYKKQEKHEIEPSLQHKDTDHSKPFLYNKEMMYSWVIVLGTYLYTKDVQTTVLAGVSSYGILRMYKNYDVTIDIDKHKLHEIPHTSHLRLFNKTFD
jgi:hypothetical protein